MTQTWRELLFLHWPVEPSEIQRQIPDELELDLYDNRAWVGIVLFKARGTRPRFMPPIPGSANFLEVNVRTYVKYNNKSGVYFFSLDANSKLAVEIASFGGFLPYRMAEMAFEKNKGQILYKSEARGTATPKEKIALRYRISSQPAVSTELEKWLTERYCLWTKPERHLLWLDIVHKPWKLKYVQGDITVNTMAPYLSNNFKNEKPMAHYSKVKKVRFFPPVIETIKPPKP
ncbi:YqjF family protein [Planococcus salinarum]|uniref:YqjF family protein n=1 Tax=Planococcus salinarum TaxID=622695 RepID=UPI00163D5E2B|nr:DUF2071 domain-containing protein [Planococcus salinarum]